MRMSNAKALLGYSVFLLAGSSEAHQIWYEQAPGKPCPCTTASMTKTCWRSHRAEWTGSGNSTAGRSATNPGR